MQPYGSKPRRYNEDVKASRARERQTAAEEVDMADPLSDEDIARLRAEGAEVRKEVERRTAPMKRRTVQAEAAASLVLSLQKDCIAERQCANRFRAALAELLEALDAEERAGRALLEVDEARALARRLLLSRPAASSPRSPSPRRGR